MHLNVYNLYHRGNGNVPAACSALCQLLQPVPGLLLHFQQITAPLPLLLDGLLDMLQGKEWCVITERFQDGYLLKVLQT